MRDQPGLNGSPAGTDAPSVVGGGRGAEAAEAAAGAGVVEGAVGEEAAGALSSERFESCAVGTAAAAGAGEAGFEPKVGRPLDTVADGAVATGEGEGALTGAAEAAGMAAGGAGATAGLGVSAGTTGTGGGFSVDSAVGPACSCVVGTGAGALTALVDAEGFETADETLASFAGHGLLGSSWRCSRNGTSSGEAASHCAAL